MSEEQIRKIIQEEIIKALGSSSAIPLQVDQAFKDRFKLPVLGKSSTAFNAFTIGFTTPDDGALEAAGAPDALLFTRINGVRYRIPAYIGSQTTAD